MENKIHLQVLTANSTVHDGMVNYVSAPLKDGEAGFLAGHAPLLAALKEGVLTARFTGEFGEETIYIAVSGGVLDIANNELIVLARTAELAENIDLARAQASERRARQRLASQESRLDHHRAQASLFRALARERCCAMAKKHK